ncbi:PDR/VanB family oxidoreductase [Microbacterium gorillae]|uniref:PDR/VanB family oxidoreductase n=1 Tax=Microbacterium gorillae TaxID=1231063 RepID=UPI00058B397F|nr:PDR/VanB family oxidoreductase [Microbacterium gorillae]
MSGLPVRVTEVIEETPQIRTLRLVRDDGLPFQKRWEAGAHVDVTGPTGVLSQYSLCSAPDDPSALLIAVKRENGPRGGSVALHGVAVGDRLLIGKPRNLLGVAADADRHVLIAGGIGVTPLLAIAYELHSRNADFELHYFARGREEAAFVDFLEERAEFRDSVALHWGVPRAEQPEAFRSILPRVSTRTHVYTCGPDGFMAAVAEVFGPVVGADAVHIEHFEAADVDTSGDTAFEVELDTGESFEIPADQSILAVLEQNGIEVFKSCEEGICGSCVSGLLEGEADHRDNCLTASEKAAGEQIALCVSRAKTPKLLIELY